ncbi:DUF502 domain-containing protein [Desulfosporosinus sp. BICA1-9]|uniref:DUF502 domain-containing protein n=1 Tax=Desulfosporosinus sp. BICA1-9 TaxID=1531958 RepID=UPI00054C596A|nr:DUF502 domain-containing protein [Desulfosporosinus sp. BICA1-9]KJS50364.1 MAG: hypothetical protein VR66_03340 [Peptococcaceae bacterium BRH_c23]KJS87404.1 MAG: hypothetical protein JL57_14185 [Desulfosporosinus sp. BICA1-9]HBW34237.1 DUF502 domain-containing protein [Desulfosporosinus sp.]
MKKFIGVFLKGLLVLTPVAITFYILYSMFLLTDGLFKGMLERAGLYFPGFGVIVTLAVIFLVGLLASNWLTNRFLNYLDKIFNKVPLLGSIYGIIKDTVNSFSANKKGFSRLVVVNMSNELKLLGFLTNDEESAFIPKGYVAVYLMQSMQWAGNLILVPEEKVQQLEVSSEDALKFIASAGLLSKKAT